MVNKNLLTLLLLIISLLSCDYQVKEYYIIENKSRFDIKVAFVERNGNDKKDTINEIVKTNATKSFYVKNSNTGIRKSKGENYLDVFDSLWISINDSLLLKKEINNLGYWDYWHNGKKEYVSKFTFSINDSDIQIIQAIR